MSQAAQSYRVFETAMGFCAIAWGDAGISRFQFPTKTADAAERLMRRRAFGAEPGALPEHVAEVLEATKRYFAGEEIDFSQVQVNLAGEDPFFARVYVALSRVGWGRTTTMARWRGRSAPAGRPRAMSAGRWPGIPRP